MNLKDKLTEATMLAIQGKLTESEQKELQYLEKSIEDDKDDLRDLHLDNSDIVELNKTISDKQTRINQLKSKKELTEDNNITYYIKLFYKDKFIGYLNSIDKSPFMIIRCVSNINDARSYKSEKRAESAANLDYLYSASYIYFYDEQFNFIGEVPFKGTMKGNTNLGVDFKDLKVEISQDTSTQLDLSDIKSDIKEFNEFILNK